MATNRNNVNNMKHIKNKNLVKSSSNSNDINQKNTNSECQEPRMSVLARASRNLPDQPTECHHANNSPRYGLYLSNLVIYQDFNFMKYSKRYSLCYFSFNGLFICLITLLLYLFIYLLDYFHLEYRQENVYWGRIS
jgi:hypothetical protein